MPANLSRVGLRPLQNVAALVAFSLLLFGVMVHSRTATASTDIGFRIGERLTYTVAFEKFSNVAYAELYTVSRGRLGEVEAVELRARVKTLDFVSAAFYLVDESRTVFVSPDSGAPLYVAKTRNVGGLPKETFQNDLAAPTGNFELVTMIYKIRQSGGSGSFNIYEGEKIHTVTFQTTASEKVRTDAGEFDTSVVNVQCEYFTEIGLRDFRINLSTDEARVPVSVRFRTAKGEFRAKVASIQNMEPQTETIPTPAPLATPRPTPGATPTPRAYVENQPLSPDLSFDLGERLEYRMTTGGQPVGSFVLHAAERKLIQNVDSLLLTATVTDANGGPLAKGDSIRAVVDPETLGPRQLDIKLSGALASVSQSVVFDEKTNIISFRGNTGKVEAPVGTHSILSLVYAIRSFNLKPSKNTSNPINDTRVAVFWEDRPYIFILRPAVADTIVLQGETVSAQLISIATGNPQLDSLGLKVWLSNDERRVPLRFVAGRYQADLMADRAVPAR